MRQPKKLKTLSDVFLFLRQNTTPIYVITPSPYNLLGLDQWVGGLEYINYFDIFDGNHRRISVPFSEEVPEFQSMEDVANHLVSHKDFRAKVKAQRPGLGLFVMFDEETERLCKKIDLEIALPSAELRTHLDSKIVTTQLGNEAGVASAPNVMGTADSYADLTKLAKDAKLGSDLVIQTPYGDSGRTTFFVKSEDDWDRYSAKIIGQELKVMKRINHLPGAVEGCATRHGTLVGPVMTDITGFEEITPYKGGWCGNDVSPDVLPDGVADKVREMVRLFGDRLYKEGYKGVFCLDFLLDTDTNEVYLGELNPRISGVTQPTNLITSVYGGCPLFMFHILEYLDVDYDIDIAEIQARWEHYDHWTQLVLKQTEDEVGLITKAPQSGIWRLNEDDEVEFVRPALNASSIGDEDEAFYMRVYGAGEYRYQGADLGCLLARGRMQSADRELLDRAKLWNDGIKAQFTSVPLKPMEMAEIPTDLAAGKWF